MIQRLLYINGKNKHASYEDELINYNDNRKNFPG